MKLNEKNLTVYNAFKEESSKFAELKQQLSQKVIYCTAYAIGPRETKNAK